MPKLPAISGKDAIRLFSKLGYDTVRQCGSHVRLHHRSDKCKKPLTIPLHKCIGKGLLRKLVRDADINVEKLIELL